MKKAIEQKTLNTIVIVLVILLALTGTALMGTVLYKNSLTDNTAVVPNNVIIAEKQEAICVPTVKSLAISGGRAYMGAKVCAMQIVDEASGKQTTLKLYRNRAEDTVPFNANNMFPGDRETKAYLLSVSYRGSLTVHFKANIRPGYEKLAEVLKCKVVMRGGSVLYDGLMKDMPNVDYILPTSNGTTSDFIYDITVYLDTSVGNEYMSKELYADFTWWVNEEEESSSSSSSESSSSSSSESSSSSSSESSSSSSSESSSSSSSESSSSSSSESSSSSSSESSSSSSSGSSGSSSDSTSAVPIIPIIPGGSDSSKPEDIPGELLPPNTGYFPNIALWASLAGVSLLLFAMLLLLIKRKKGGKANEQ